MSARWWRSERSKTAAAVRATRRRLRASYRAATRRAEAAARDRVSEQEALAARAFDEAADAAIRFARVTATAQRYLSRNALMVTVELDDSLIVRADREALFREVGRYIGAAVQREWNRTSPAMLDSGRWKRPEMPKVSVYAPEVTP